MGGFGVMTKQKQSKKLPIFLIIGPALGIVLSTLLYAIINFVSMGFLPEGSSSESIFGGAGIFVTVSNVFLFLLGAVSVLALVPCLIIGIIILNKHSDNKRHETDSDEENESRAWGDLE
jgi:uncharacterized membrane protein